MQENIYTQWATQKTLHQKYLIKKIIDDVNLFKVIFINSLEPNTELITTFETRMFSYKKTLITLRKKTIDNLITAHGKDFITKWTFFKIENSTWAKKISDESYNFISYEQLVHHVFIAENMFVEFITHTDPVVSFVTKKII